MSTLDTYILKLLSICFWKLPQIVKYTESVVSQLGTEGLLAIDSNRRTQLFVEFPPSSASALLACGWQALVLHASHGRPLSREEIARVRAAAIERAANDYQMLSGSERQSNKNSDPVIDIPSNL